MFSMSDMQGVQVTEVKGEADWLLLPKAAIQPLLNKRHTPAKIPDQSFFRVSSSGCLLLRR